MSTEKISMTQSLKLDALKRIDQLESFIQSTSFDDDASSLLKAVLDLLNLQMDMIGSLEKDRDFYMHQLMNCGFIVHESAKFLHYKRQAEAASDIIQKQKAEIERYLHSIKLLEKDVADARAELNEFKKLYVDRITSMAIKEFAERYEKAVLPLLTSATIDKKDGLHACLDILNEMVGDE